MHIFKYGQKEVDHLSERDPRMAQAIRGLGMIERKITPDPLAALAFSIISQQISGKAAENISRRFLGFVGGNVTPISILSHTPEELKTCGISLRKATFIHRIAAAFSEGHLSGETLADMDDRELLNTLTVLPGVGPWTAEMLMIFSLQRPNVLSWGDFGIRKGLMILHNRKDLDKKHFQTLQELYSPYCTVASFYLWAIASGEYIPTDPVQLV